MSTYLPCTYGQAIVICGFPLSPLLEERIHNRSQLSQMEEAQRRRSRMCECGRDAVEKVAGPRSPNHDLRYLCCDRFVYFGKKKNYCRFFEWIDQPRVTKEQNKEAQALKCQSEKAAFFNTPACLPAGDADRVVEELGNHCESVGSLQEHKDDFELEIRKASPQARTVENAENAAVGCAIGAREGITAEDMQVTCVENVSLPRAQTWNGSIDNCLGQEQQPSSPTHLIKQDTDGNNFKDNIDLSAKVGCDTELNVFIGFPPSHEDKQTLATAHDILEIPTCLCFRAAVLKTVKSRGPNQGLRFWVCSNSRPFFVKKKRGKEKDGEESCKFFRWLDTPLEKSDTQREEEKQRKKENCKRKELSNLS